MPASEQWWRAATKAVGPVPILAPGALAFVSLCTLAATSAHPAMKG